jgi:hypothetical protein
MVRDAGSDFGKQAPGDFPFVICHFSFAIDGARESLEFTVNVHVES